MCPRSWAAATPVKYKRDIQQLTYVLAIVKKSENNRTEEISLVTPTPGRAKFVKDLYKTLQFSWQSDFVGPANFQAGLELYDVAGPDGLYLVKLKVRHWKQPWNIWVNTSHK